ncbi:MAG: VWA domain-containing protein, partial [Proteobacteria bacterium]
MFLVMDTSGSMAGAAIDNARKAAESVVKRLQDTDTFALVTFSSDADLLVASGPIGPRRKEVLERIRTVEAVGGTNISAGLDLAYGEARHAQTLPGGDNAVSVALLLSDGQATAGDTNANALAARSSQAFQEGIQTSAFGVGTQFDAPLMSTVADRGAGGYYFLADSSQIAKALATELDARLRPVATAVELRVRLGDGVVPTKVYGSKQLSQVESMAVRAQEVAIDQREAAKKDIAQDRQEDTQSGMRFFLPAFAAADKHATLLEVR